MNSWNKERCTNLENEIVRRYQSCTLPAKCGDLTVVVKGFNENTSDRTYNLVDPDTLLTRDCDLPFFFALLQHPYVLDVVPPYHFHVRSVESYGDSMITYTCEINKDCPELSPGEVNHFNTWLVDLKEQILPYVLPVFELHGLIHFEGSFKAVTGTREVSAALPAGMGIYVETETKGRIKIAEKKPVTREQRLECFVTEYVVRNGILGHKDQEYIPIAGGLFSTFLAEHIRKFGWDILEAYFEVWGFFQSGMASLGFHFDPSQDLCMLSTQIVQSDEPHIFDRVHEYIRIDHPDPPPLSEKPKDLSPFDALADGGTHYLRLFEINVLHEIFKAMRDDKDPHETIHQVCTRPEILTEALEHISDQNMMDLLRDLEEEEEQGKKKKKKSKKKRKAKKKQQQQIPEWNMWNGSWYDPIEEALRLFFLRTCHPTRYSIF